MMNSLGALLRSWPAYDASLCQRGSLTTWFTDEAIAAWASDPERRGFRCFAHPASRSRVDHYSPFELDLRAKTIEVALRLGCFALTAGSIVANLRIAFGGK